MATSKKKSRVATFFTDILFDVVGCTIFAVSIQSFSAPNNIAPGGVSGVSVLLNYLFGLKISVLALALNIPLLILAWLFLGHKFTLKTLKTVGIMTVLLELCGRYLPVYEGDIILAALYGGVLEGIGIAMVFMRSSTTGGTDVASRLIQLKFPNVPVGKLMMAVDACVLVSAAIVYQNIENALYGLITIYACTRVIDSILYGLDTGKVMMITSVKYEEIAKKVHTELGRGGTILDGKGSYTGNDRPVLLCAVRKSQFYELKKLVHGIDPDAFMVALEANEIIGEGFKSIDQKK